MSRTDGIRLQGEDSLHRISRLLMIQGHRACHKANATADHSERVSCKENAIWLIEKRHVSSRMSRRLNDAKASSDQISIAN
jgi:uncharacterized protein with PIN domain